jgi:hypothetical protein
VISGRILECSWHLDVWYDTWEQEGASEDRPKDLLLCNESDFDVRGRYIVGRCTRSKRGDQNVHSCRREWTLIHTSLAYDMRHAPKSGARVSYIYICL